MGILQEFIKGNISATDVSVGGVLRPEAANKFIDLVIEQSNFLKMITVERTRKIKKDINVLDIANRVLVRVPEGSEPTDAQKAGIINKGKTLSCLPVQLFETVLFSTIDDNQDNPNFEDGLVSMFAKKFANELEDLAFNGIGEDGSNFLNLNKGFVALAKEYTNTKKVDVGTLSSGYVNALKAVLDAQENKFYAKSVLIMSEKDHRGLVLELGNKPSGVGYLVQGGIPSFLGKPIITNPYMPDNHVLFAPLDVFVFGIVRDIERYREVRGTKRCIDYTYNINCDYELAIDESVVIGYDIV